ncbi:MAG: metal ABC transporter permease [bacterium]
MEILQYDFIHNAIWASLLGGATCGVIGVLVITLNLSFIGTCMSHAALAGAILALIFSFPSTLTAFIFCLLAAGVIGPLADKARFQADTSLAIIFSLMLGLSFLFLNMLDSSKSEALDLLWGSILTVTNTDLSFMVLTFLIAAAFIVLFFKEIQAIIFDRRIALALGLPAKAIYYFTLLLIGFVITSFFTSIGGMLIFSLIINPAAAAYQLTYRLSKLFIFSAVFGVLSCLLGLWAAYILDVPAGAIIVITSVVIFLLAMLISPKNNYSLVKFIRKEVDNVC